jgi:hypothetical protein
MEMEAEGRDSVPMTLDMGQNNIALHGDGGKRFSQVNAPLTQLNRDSNPVV